MKPSRFTRGGLMLTIAIALATLASLGYTLWCRSAEFAEQAEVHGGRMLLARNAASGAVSLELTEEEEAERVALERIGEYEERMYHKYRQAAGLPWLPIAPDPNPPAAGPPLIEARMQWWLPVAADSNTPAGRW